MSKSLYDLNKDELICLISTIQERTKKETEERCDKKRWTEICQILNKAVTEQEEFIVTRNKCKLCENAEYIVSDIIYKANNIKIYNCTLCNSKYCENHLKENTIKCFVKTERDQKGCYNTDVTFDEKGDKYICKTHYN